MNPSFEELLRSAVEEPGIISGAYSAFHNYSFGNQLLAWAQCAERGIQLSGEELNAAFRRFKALADSGGAVPLDAVFQGVPA